MPTKDHLLHSPTFRPHVTDRTLTKNEAASTRLRVQPQALLPTAITLVALLLRILCLFLCHLLEARINFQYFGLEALLVSRSLANGRGFSGPFPNYPYVTAWLAPVYPSLVSLGEMVFGLKNHNIVIFAQVLNVVFSALTCYPIYDLTARTFGSKTGATAAWIWAFLPPALLMPIAWTWDQSLSAFLLISLVWATVRLRYSSSTVYWSAYGLLWAIAALTNPTLCVLLPFVGAWLLLDRRNSKRPSIALLARAAICFVVALLPWTLRNYKEFGDIFFVKSNFGVELWLGNNPAVTDVHARGVHPLDNPGELRFLTLTNERFYDHVKEKNAIRFIRDNPDLFLKHVTNRIVDTWTAKFDSRTDSFVQALGIAQPYVVFTTLFSLFTLGGLWVAFRSHQRESQLFALCLLIFPMPYYLTHTSMRYRHPIDPLMVIVAAVVFARVRGTEVSANTINTVEYPKADKRWRGEAPMG